MPRLRRTSPEQPGWTRRRAGRGFVYLDERGNRLPEDDARRVRDLVIPPAWRDVWVTPHDNGHLQAVGTDEAGRRQYLDHPVWRAKRDAEKFDRMQEFGRTLVKERQLVVADLGQEGMPLERACAAAVRLLDLGYFRIGNDIYADTHGSFGLTTLERRHVLRRQDLLVFAFVGKSGVDHRIEIDDVTVVEAIEIMCRRRARTRHCSPTSTSAPAPGWTPRPRTSAPGTPRCSPRPRLPGPTSPATPRPRAGVPVTGAMKEVAEFLGNTPTLARSAYVDPRVIEAYEEGRTIAATTRRTHDTPDERQAALERATLKLLKET